MGQAGALDGASRGPSAAETPGVSSRQRRVGPLDPRGESLSVSFRAAVSRLQGGEEADVLPVTPAGTGPTPVMPPPQRPPGSRPAPEPRASSSPCAPGEG